MIHEVQNRLEGVSEMQDLRQTLLNIADRGVTDVHDAVKDSGLATLYTATTQNRMGDLSKELGNFNQAKLHYEKALEIARGLANDHPRHNDVKQSLAFSLWSLGDISIMSGQHAQAERRYREALRLSQEVVAADRSNTGARRSLSIAYDRMGDVFRDNGRFREAVGYFQKAIGEARNLAKQLPDDKELKRDLAVICLKLGSVNLKLKKPDQAEEYYRQGHMLCLDLASANRDSVRAKRDLAISYARLAERAQHVGDARQALDLLLRSHQIYSSLAKKDPRNAILKRDLAISYTNLGQVDLKLDEIEEARIYFEEAIRSWEELTRSPSAPFQDRQGLVLAQKRLAIAELRAGLDAQAQDRLILIRDLLEELGDEKVVATNAAFRKWLDRQQRDLRSLEQDGALTQ